VLSSDNDRGDIRLSNAFTGRTLMLLRGEPGIANVARLSPDDRFILVSTYLGTRIYACGACAPVTELLAIAKQRVTRQLTPVERQIHLPPIEATPAP
jgi:hypothetical protein